MGNSNPEQHRAMAEMLRKVQISSGLRAILSAQATVDGAVIAGSTDDLLEALKRRLHLGENGLRALEEGLIQIGRAEFMDDDDFR